MKRTTDVKPAEERRWRLWQVETAIACNLDCIMCPWKKFRQQAKKPGTMDQLVWQGLLSYLPQVSSVDFTGGGEPLLQPRLLEWILDAKAAGCHTGFLTNGVLLDRRIAAAMIDADVDWIAVSLDGASADTYEMIRKGARFKQVCVNLASLGSLRIGKKPTLMLNVVMMSINAHELEDIVRMAARLGVDQINFKQCDIVRGEHGKGFGLFASEKTKSVKQFNKICAKARRLARKLKIQTAAFSFTPAEQAVCDQDPRDSLFVRYDGTIAPCINLAIGGPSIFLGEEVNFPSVHYGNILKKNLMKLWQTETCRFYRSRFNQRVQAFDAVLISSSFETSWPKVQEIVDSARDAMPKPPEGCDICHYLYGI